jgi:hypothetical protein
MIDEEVAEQSPEDLNTVNEELKNTNEEDGRLDIGNYEDLESSNEDLNSIERELETDGEEVAEQSPEDLKTVDEELKNTNEEDEQLDFGEYEDLESPNEDLNPIAGELETDEDLKNSDKTLSEELTEEGSHEELSEATETAEEDPEITDEIVKTPRKGLDTSNEDVAGESQEVDDDTSSNANTEDKEVLDDEYHDGSHEEPEDNKITPSSESDGGNSRPNLKVGNRDLQTSDEYYDEDPEYPEGANDDNDDTLDDADEKEYAEDFAEDTDDALTDDTNAGDNPGDIVEDDGLTTQEYYDESHEDSEDNEITPRSGADGGNGPPKSKTGTRTGDLKLGDDDYAEDPEGENYDYSHEDSEGEVPEKNDDNYEDSEGEVPESNDENYDDNHEDSEEYDEYSEHDIDDEKG